MNKRTSVGVEPCVVCKGVAGVLNGPRGAVPPQRTSLARFGMDGRACHACYARLRGRFVSGLPLQPEVAKLPRARGPRSQGTAAARWYPSR